MLSLLLLGGTCKLEKLVVCTFSTFEIGFSLLKDTFLPVELIFGLQFLN